LGTDVDGVPKVDISHTGGGKFQNWAPSNVFEIVDVSNPSTTTFAVQVQIVDTLPTDAQLTTPGVNVKVCFYDGSVPSGYPYSPGNVWGPSACSGATKDITSDAGVTISGTTTVTVTLNTAELTALGGFGQGDHIAVAMKTQFALAGTTYSSSYFAAGPNSAGTYYHLFTNSATATANDPTTTQTATLSFRGYDKGVGT
jgi:hypothetical protein